MPSGAPNCPAADAHTVRSRTGEKLKIFLGWSGPVALKVASLFRERLPLVLPYAKPWVSEEDIAKGTLWSADLWRNLKSAKYGIICIVPSIASEAWISFEAGALACAQAKSKVSPFLLGVTPNELPGPLKQFQCTKANKHNILQLIKRINQVSSKFSIDNSQLETTFNAQWRGFYQRLRRIDLEPVASPNLPDSTNDKLDSKEKTLNELDDLSVTILTTLATAMKPGLTVFGIHLQISRPQRLIELRLIDLYKRSLVRASSNHIDLAWFNVTTSGLRLLDKKGLL